jgi:NADH dehydrogenase [ubiquinone] 1 alpha subcomplex assembly factor 7
MLARPMPADDESTSLAARLKDRIAREGFLSIAEYMEACLSDARAGYYSSRQPIGAAGDFTTAPEISQIFGELLGAWAVAVWQSMGSPKEAVIAELGPGRGTLMADALRAWRSVPDFLGSISVALVETSGALREMQKKTLRGSPAEIVWCERIEDVPLQPLILIANEFLDALPIRQFVRRGHDWRERGVTLDRNGAFAFTEGKAVPHEELPHAGAEPPAEDGDIIEVRPAVSSLVLALASRARQAPLAALFIDYGHVETACGDTLQAVQRHRFTDPLALPGTADLTAHVDFAELRRLSETLGLAVYGPLPQAEFLLKLGLAERRNRLSERASPEQREAIASGAARLVDPRQMGMLFKTIALTSEGLPPPPPFSQY